MTRFLLWSGVVLVFASVVMMLCGNTMLPLGPRLQMAGLMGLLIGASSILLTLPWVGLAYAWLRRPPRKVWLGWLLMGLPGGLLLGFTLKVTLWMTLPQLHQATFEKITGKDWPAKAHLLTHRHTLLLADHKHVWFFESEPEVFEQFCQTQNWLSLQAEDRPRDLMSGRFPWKAIQATAAGDWSPEEFWVWDAKKEATRGPYGPAYLIADKDRRHWCIWWDGM